MYICLFLFVLFLLSSFLCLIKMVEKSRSGHGSATAASGPEFCAEPRSRIDKRSHGDPNQAKSAVLGVSGGASASPAANVHFFGRRGGLMWPCQATEGA